MDWPSFKLGIPSRDSVNYRKQYKTQVESGGYKLIYQNRYQILQRHSFDFCPDLDYIASGINKRQFRNLYVFDDCSSELL